MEEHTMADSTRVTKYLDRAEHALEKALNEENTDKQGHLTAIANTYGLLAARCADMRPAE